jgi:hypothetical protein
VPADVALLRARERSKRFIVGGLIIALYASCWLFLGWRASRTVETECTVVYVEEAAACTLQHIADGEAHTLPYENCRYPRRWPSEPIGSVLDCYYYQNAPSDIFLEPREHRWFTFAPAFALGLGLTLAGFGILRRPRGRATPVAPERSPYRAASRGGLDVPPLRVPLSEAHWSRWFGGGPLFVIGLALVGLVGVLQWTAGGERGPFDLFLVAFSHVVTLWGAFALFHRSGLVIGKERCVYWWGLGGPWFESSRSLDALVRAEGKRDGSGRTTSHWLILHFADAAPWRFRRAASDEAQAEALRITQYLDSLRTPS